MNKTALSHRILMEVEKPSRYLGNEINSIHKSPGEYEIRFAMCFPDVYEIGMSHLGLQIIYHMLNMRKDTFCERVFSPWTDLIPIMRSEGIGLFGLESQEPIKNFDFLGITIQYEMCYTNILGILDLSGIPIYGKDRGEDDPIVIGGGPCIYNPEPLADFFDLFYIGEGEVCYDALLDLYKTCKSRNEFLKKAAFIEGIYVPSLYDVSYNDDGTIEDFGPTDEGCAPDRIKRVIVKDLDGVPYPDKPIIPFTKTIQDRLVLEIQRGCIRGCRFCQAGMVYRPIRRRSPEKLKDLVDKMIKETGYEEITLSSLSSSDYPWLSELIEHLTVTHKKDMLNISLPSLRIDSFSLDIMERIQDIRKVSLTFAPEAGSQRLRDVINKGLTKEEILAGAGEAFKGGWSRVKLYFMFGLPTEEDDDVKAISELCNDIAEEFYSIPKDQRPAPGRVDIVCSTSFFVPKPFTPFQWARQNGSEEFLTKQHILNKEIKTSRNHKSIKYNWHDSDTTYMEGIFARGDRRLSAVIERAYKKGCIYDAWSDMFRFDLWMEAFEEEGIDPSFYLRERSYDEILPWDHIDVGVTKEFLRREAENALKGKVTENCSESCSGCGCTAYGCGICIEERT